MQEDEYVCKIRCSVQRLAFQAASSSFKLPLEPASVAEAATKGLPEYDIAPFEINDARNITPYAPYEFLYARFVTGEPDCFNN